jgi:hypothetical protein
VVTVGAGVDSPLGRLAAGTNRIRPGRPRAVAPLVRGRLRDAARDPRVRAAAAAATILLLLAARVLRRRGLTGRPPGVVPGSLLGWLGGAVPGTGDRPAHLQTG